MKQIVGSRIQTATVTVLIAVATWGGFGTLQAQKKGAEVRSCLPVSTNWRLGPELNHLTWMADSLGCNDTRILILQPSHSDAFRELFHAAGREYVHKALGPPVRSFINAARLHLDVYAISCEVEDDGQGLDAVIVYTKDGCLGEIFFQGK